MIVLALKPAPVRWSIVDKVRKTNGLLRSNANKDQRITFVDDSFDLLLDKDGILHHVSHCNVILYASPGKEGFYEKHGFRKMKTGMARFTKSEAMREGGFTE